MHSLPWPFIYSIRQQRESIFFSIITDERYFKIGGYELKLIPDNFGSSQFIKKKYFPGFWSGDVIDNFLKMQLAIVWGEF